MSRAMMICMLATSLAVSVGCSAQAPRVIAQKLYDQVDQSYANQDLNHVLGFYDSSYVTTNAQGKRVSFAALRKDLEQVFAVTRRMDPSTTIEDVQLKAGRMVVYYKSEMHFEFQDQRDGWVPKIYKETGEDTWEKKGDQWKLVQGHTLRAKTQVDPKWEAEKNATIQRSIDDARDIIRCSGGCPPQ